MGAKLEVHFIDNLVQKTIENQIQWDYICDFGKKHIDHDPRKDNSDLNKRLDSQANWDKEQKELIWDRSFYTMTKTGYVYIISEAVKGRSAPLKLYVQKDKNSKLNHIDSSGLDSELYRLNNAIIYALEGSNFEDAQKFMSDFLNE